MDFDMPRQWDNKPELKEKLELAGWRYAQLIEIVNLKHNGDLSESDKEIISYLDQDKSSYGHFVKAEEYEGKMLPVWDQIDAITFVSEVAGVNKKLADAWLKHDWPG
jgi:hypothetical protein